MTVQVSTLKLFAGALLLAAITFANTFAVDFATSPNHPAARRIVQFWNAAVSTIEAEDQNFRELLESYQRFPPGAVLMPSDVRDSQRKRRLRLIDDIIASHEERVRSLRSLAEAETALP